MVHDLPIVYFFVIDTMVAFFLFVFIQQLWSGTKGRIIASNSLLYFKMSS